MPELTLLQNLTAAWQQNTVVTNYYNLGWQFFPEHDGEIRGIAWYRASTGTNRTPSRIQLWDVATATKLEEDTTPPDSGAVGWQVYTFATPVPVLAGQVLCVTLVHPIGNTQAYLNPGARPAPPNGLAFHVYDRRSIANAVTFPTTQDAGSFGTPVDVIYYTDAEIGESGDHATVGDVRAVLSEWLHSTANDHPLTSTTYLSWQILTAMETVIDAMNDKIDTLDALLETALGPIGNLATGALRAFLDDLQGKIDDVQEAVGPFINDHTTAAKEEVLTAIDAIPTGGGGLAQGPVSVANGWTLRTSTTGNGSVKWNEPADAYILVREAWDANRHVNVYEDVNYFFDRGWWSPQQDDIVEGYGTLAAATHILRVPTGRMSGVLIVQDADFDFTLQAWDAPSGAP